MRHRPAGKELSTHVMVQTKDQTPIKPLPHPVETHLKLRLGHTQLLISTAIPR